MTKAFIVARQNDLAKKRQQKAYADSRQRAVSLPVKEGDKVLLQQLYRDKLSTYDPRPYTVVARKGLSVVLQRGTDPQILRNVSHVHKLYKVDGNSCNDDLFPVARAQGPENVE